MRRGAWCIAGGFALVMCSCAAGSGAPVRGDLSLWSLFIQSFDIFTIALLAGSVAGGAIIYRAMVDIRESRIMPPESTRRLRELVAGGKWRALEEESGGDPAFIARVVHAAMAARGAGREAMREAADLAASDECARWFRRIEPLNVIGNLGPLVGLAGTVWGMIIAFTSLGETGGQAGPADLSVGISKALFHTLLGLCLAIPCLLVFGLYRSVIDRHCNRAMVLAAGLVERIPVESDVESRA